MKSPRDAVKMEKSQKEGLGNLIIKDQGEKKELAKEAKKEWPMMWEEHQNDVL